MDIVIEFVTNMTLLWWGIVCIGLLSILTEGVADRSNTYKGVNLVNCCFLAVAYMLFRPSLTAILLMAVAWMPIGLCWAICKWKLRIQEVTQHIKQHNLKPKAPEDVWGYDPFDSLMQRITVPEQKSALAHWIIFWPSSMVSTLILNLQTLIETLVVTHIGGRLTRMADNALVRNGIDKG